MILLFIMVIISECIQEDTWFLRITAVLVILIPTVYSFVPLLESYKLKKNRSNNRLSENTFTDREEDVNNILNKLSISEHIIEITGDDRCCGKTWIAKRIVDYINFPKDSKPRKKAFPYKSAYYLDLNSYDEQQLEVFFDNHIINSKVVLIFDNVSNINYLLSKQSRYHFQLVYVMKTFSDNYYFKHSVSKFHEENIRELHEKIRYNYPGIDNISEDEIKILYRITDGNVGKIASILSKQNSVQWLKDISVLQRTQYDDMLDGVELLLYTGEYEHAKKALCNFEAQNNKYFQENNDLFYKYIMKKADCEHLLNNYEEALSLLSIIEVHPYCLHSKNNELQLSKAHYLKHIWKCNEALEILYKISRQSFSAQVDSLGILLAKHFINDESVPYSDQSSLEEFYNSYVIFKNNNIENQNINNQLKHKRCTAIYHYYKYRPKDPQELIESISEVIQIYKSQNNRLLANAYFIRAEIYRLYENYEYANKDYKLCLSVTNDNNIILQTNLMVLYLIKGKKINLDFDILSANQINELCKHNNYGKKVYNRINSILLGDEGANSIVQCFETRIMPIL